MAETFRHPESPAAAAILHTVVAGFARVYAVAALKRDILGIHMLSSLEGTFLAPTAPEAGSVAATSGTETEAPTDPEVPAGDGHDPLEPADTPVVVRDASSTQPAAPAGNPGKISLLADWPDEVHAQRDERQRRAEKQRLASIDADQAYTEAVQSHGAEQVRERRDDAMNTGTRVVRGADGQAVGVLTTGDGEVIGVSPAADPASLPD
jgi:hypothetical protein